jgi:uncharacterized membrane protein
VCSVDYQGLCRFKAYSTFLLLQQLFVGVWATRSVDSLCLCRFKAYSTFFILQQLFVGVQAVRSVALFGLSKYLVVVSLVFIPFFL